MSDYRDYSQHVGESAHEAKERGARERRHIRELESKWERERLDPSWKWSTRRANQPIAKVSIP